MSDEGKRKTFKFLTPWKSGGGGNINTDQGDVFMSSSKPGRPRAVAPAATSRQAQNRTAQRAYRERKERYVKDLEREVQRLRAEAARVHALNEEMAKKLRESGTVANDSLPPYFKSDQTTKEAKTAYLFVCKLESICADHFDFPKDSKDSHGHQLLISHPDNPNKGAAALLKTQMQDALNSYSAGSTLVGSNDEAQIQNHPLSVDYLSSVFGIKEESLSPHTTSHSHSHSHSPSPSYMANEITPVQVWEKVSTHPQLQNLNLTSICNYLRQKAKCHGYGAVIEQEEVDYILEVEYGLSLEQQKQIEQISGLSLQPVQRQGQGEDLPPPPSNAFDDLQFSPSMAQFSDSSQDPVSQNNMSPESFAYQSFGYSPQSQAQQHNSSSPEGQYNQSQAGQLHFDSTSPEGYSEMYTDFQGLPTMHSQDLDLNFSESPGKSANVNTSSDNVLYSSQPDQNTSSRSKFKLGKGYVD